MTAFARHDFADQGSGRGVELVDDGQTALSPIPSSGIG
jgi:hypothetical protein